MASKYGPIKAVIPNRASHDFNNLVLGRSTRYSAAKITKCPARALCKPIRQSIGGAKVKRMAYQKDDQPVKIDSSGEDFADNVDSLLKKYGSKPSKSKNVKKESFETKQDNILNEDLNKMKKLIGYGKKTQ